MTDEEAIRIVMQGKIIRCCSDCAFFRKGICLLGHNKESNPRDRFFDDCGLEDIEKHDTEVRAEVVDNIVSKLVAMEEEYRFEIRDKDCMQDDAFSDGILSAMFTVIQSIKKLKEQKK